MANYFVSSKVFRDIQMLFGQNEVKLIHFVTYNHATLTTNISILTAGIKTIHISYFLKRSIYINVKHSSNRDVTQKRQNIY